MQKISDNLKPVSFDESSYIIREGEPIDTAYFIMRGVAIEWSFKARVNGEATTSSSQYPNWLEKGAFFGQELLHEWTSGQQASSSSNISNLPLSSKIVKIPHKSWSLCSKGKWLEEYIVSKTKFHVDEERLENDVASKYTGMKTCRVHIWYTSQLKNCPFKLFTYNAISSFFFLFFFLNFFCEKCIMHVEYGLWNSQLDLDYLIIKLKILLPNFWKK